MDGWMDDGGSVGKTDEEIKRTAQRGEMWERGGREKEIEQGSA